MSILMYANLTNVADFVFIKKNAFLYMHNGHEQHFKEIYFVHKNMHSKIACVKFKEKYFHFIFLTLYYFFSEEITMYIFKIKKPAFCHIEFHENILVTLNLWNMFYYIIADHKIIMYERTDFEDLKQKEKKSDFMYQKLT